MRRAASSGTLWAANCLQLCCRRTDRLLGFGRAPLRPACARSPRIPIPSPPHRLVRACGGRGKVPKEVPSVFKCSVAPTSPPPPSPLSFLSLSIIAAIGQLPKIESSLTCQLEATVTFSNRHEPSWIFQMWDIPPTQHQPSLFFYQINYSLHLQGHIAFLYHFEWKEWQKKMEFAIFLLPFQKSAVSAIGSLLHKAESTFHISANIHFIFSCDNTE